MARWAATLRRVLGRPARRGNGGIGLYGADGVTLTNTGTIQGGNGGAAGTATGALPPE